MSRSNVVSHPKAVLQTAGQELIAPDPAIAQAAFAQPVTSFVIGKTAKDQIEGVRIVGAVPYSVFDSTIQNMLSAQ